MIRVGLARTRPGYEGLRPPFDPGARYPELEGLLVEDLGAGGPNPVYAGVRAALHAAGLDEARFGSPQWNPLGSLVAPGGHVVLKPNFIRHWNPLEGRGGSLDSVTTHGSVIRAVADYAFLAVGPEGRVTLAEAPQQDCDFDAIRRLVGLDELVDLYRRRLGRELEVIDLRRERVVFRDGILCERHELPGDPLGYRAIDLGSHSFFSGCGLDPKRFRGADYDPGPTSIHHRGGRHEYLLSESVLRADLLVNLPKMKTHKKTGVTLALKNLVGVNGDKNWLPHHCAGAPAEGGDEFPDGRPLARWRGAAVELARPWLARGRLLGLFRAVRRVEKRAVGDEIVRSGNWHGNQTTWRMCCDLNRAVYYSDREGLRIEAPRPVRRVLTVLDGVVAGEGEGPLAPSDVPLGVLVAGEDPIAVDLVAIRLMGFDPERIPKVAQAMDDVGARITDVRGIEDVGVGTAGEAKEPIRVQSVLALTPQHRFRPHPGWLGSIEDRSAPPASGASVGTTALAAAEGRR